MMKKPPLPPGTCFLVIYLLSCFTTPTHTQDYDDEDPRGYPYDFTKTGQFNFTHPYLGEHEKEVDEQVFNSYWPTRDSDDRIFSGNQQGEIDWSEFADVQIDKYKNEYKKRKDELFSLHGASLSGKEKIAWNNPPRPYPYCVDGYLPHMDRYDYYDPTSGLLPKDSTTGLRPDWSVDWGLTTGTTDPDGNKLYKEPPRRDCTENGIPNPDCLDFDVENFLPLFKASQPINGPIVANEIGKPNTFHLLNGNDEGPFITKITFSKMFSPPPPLGIRSSGSPELPFWISIIVHSREPLEGLYLQAIGYPMGLPFGNFHDDFDCDAKELSKTTTRVTDYNKDDGSKTNIIVPCKYSHGNNNGDMYPNVYAYGGNKAKVWDKHTEFKVHFRWSSVHCNMKMRIQFLVLAVRNFASHDFEAFLTANYLLNQVNAAGSPPPILKGSYADHGWDRNITCNEENVVTKNTDPNRVVLEYDEKTSRFPIPYDGLYDKCIRNDRTLTNFYADKLVWSTELFNLTAAPSPAPVLNNAKLNENWEPARKMAQICPPADICLNEKHNPIVFDDNGHPKDAEITLRNFSNSYKNSFPTCDTNFCRHPKYSVRRLKFANDSNLKIKDSKDEGGTRFSENFTRGFYNRGASHFRKMRGTHVWCMTFAWFVLMTIGGFTARYYKESGGINSQTRNSLLGLGWWIWVHIILFLLSLTFMWIGILETSRFRQKPVSCNLLELYRTEYRLKNFCRYNKRLVRTHRKVGIAAVVFYHIALVISWARPVKSPKIIGTSFKFPLRKFFLWVHVLCAYIGKIICIISVALLFSKKAPGICKSIPWVLMITEFLSIVFFAGGWVFQFFEDRTLRVSRRVFPVPEALEPGDSSPCYWFKVLIVVASVLVHFGMFIFIIVIVVNVYGKPGGHANEAGAFENLTGVVFGECHVTSLTTELDSSMMGYYYRKAADASDG